MAPAVGEFQCLIPVDPHGQQLFFPLLLTTSLKVICWEAWDAVKVEMDGMTKIRTVLQYSTAFFAPRMSW